jgi:ribosome biogenesis protein MAK21
MSRKVDASPEEAYDPRKRDPRYAHASASPLWELVSHLLLFSCISLLTSLQTPLLSHYHPAISLHASQLLSGRPLTANADLSLNTLTHFLDRFVYKNPKKPRAKGESAMQPGATAADGATGVKLVRGEVNTGEATVNDEKWWGKRKESDVPADEVFFLKFFTQRSEREKAKAAKTQKRKKGGKDEDDQDESADEEESDDEDAEGIAEDDEDASEEDSDAEEAEIWKVRTVSLPVASVC